MKVCKCVSVCARVHEGEADREGTGAPVPQERPPAQPPSLWDELVTPRGHFRPLHHPCMTHRIGRTRESASPTPQDDPAPLCGAPRLQATGSSPCSEPPLDWPLPPCSPEVLLLLGSPRLSLSPLAHFWAHIPRSVFSAKAASVPYCWQCASIARSKMWGFSCLAASQGLRAGTVPCHSGPALKTLSGTDTRWRRLAWPHKALGRSSPFPGEWTPISIILVGSTLQGCVMVHIFPCLAEHHFTM